MSTEKAKTSGVEKDIKLSTKIRYDDDGEEIKADQNFSNDVSSEDGGVQLPQVVSPNAWETVDLGDLKRKGKFLRLMGAAKKEHKGRFVIGETEIAGKHSRPRESEEKLEDKLESQFKQSMADHLKQKDKRHRGLGFDTDEPSVKKFATNNDPSKTSDATDHPADKPIHFVSQDGGKQLDL